MNVHISNTERFNYDPQKYFISRHPNKVKAKRCKTKKNILALFILIKIESKYKPVISESCVVI